MESVPEDTGDSLPQDLLRPEERQVLIGEQQVAVTSRTTDALIRWYIAPAMIVVNATLLLFVLPRVVNAEFMGLVIRTHLKNGFVGENGWISSQNRCRRDDAYR